MAELDDKQIAAIEARKTYQYGTMVNLTVAERDALCATVKQLRAENDRLKLSKDELRVLTDYHYYEAEKAITRTGDSASQRLHLERLATLRGMEVIWP